jgi:hypothetical protein
LAPSAQQAASAQVAQAPAVKTPTQLPAPPAPELLEALAVVAAVVEVASLVLVVVEVAPPVPVVPPGVTVHERAPRGVVTAATRSQRRVFMVCSP